MRVSLPLAGYPPCREFRGPRAYCADYDLVECVSFVYVSAQTMSAAGGAPVAQMAQMSLKEMEVSAAAAEKQTIECVFASVDGGSASYDKFVWCKNPGCGFLCATCNEQSHAVPAQCPEGWGLSAKAFETMVENLHPANHARRSLTIEERAMLPGTRPRLSVLR